MKRTLLALIAAIVSLGSAGPLSACTSAVISGKVTPDGRPLLWKNRDTDFPQNSVRYFSGGRYPFVAVVNSVEDNPTDVWIGTNAAGFSIMNTQSYNLVELKPGEERGEANGRVMRRALEVCATVQDFRQFLDTLSKPSLIEANTSAPGQADWEWIEGTSKHTFTHFHLESRLVSAEIPRINLTDGIWVPLTEVENIGLPTVFKKIAALAPV